MARSPTRQQIIREILRMTRPGDVQRALLSAGLVESGMRHIPYGHSSSMGFLQQRPDMGWGPYRPGIRGVRMDIRDFLRRANPLARKYRGNPGALAQAVQRSAFPERYGQRMKEVNAILRGAGPTVRHGGTPGNVTYGQDRRRALASALMASNQMIIEGRYDPNVQLQLLLQAKATANDLVPKGPGGRSNVGLGGLGGAKGGAAAMLAAIRKAQKMGLSVRENPFVDPVERVHTTNSWHYRNFPGRYRGRRLGRGADISGDPAKMRAFARWLIRNRAREEELFHDPLGGRYRIGGHGGHVHVAY